MTKGSRSDARRDSRSEVAQIFGAGVREAISVLKGERSLPESAERIMVEADHLERRPNRR